MQIGGKNHECHFVDEFRCAFPSYHFARSLRSSARISISPLVRRALTSFMHFSVTEDQYSKKIAKISLVPIKICTISVVLYYWDSLKNATYIHKCIMQWGSLIRTTYKDLREKIRRHVSKSVLSTWALEHLIILHVIPSLFWEAYVHWMISDTFCICIYARKSVYTNSS